MINPAMFGVNQQQVEAARQLGNYVGVRIVKERAKHCLSLEFVAKRPPEELAQVNIDLGQMLDAYVNSMATQLYNYMGIGGEIEEV